MKETSKANRRRKTEGEFWDGIFRGRGIDIGSGDDPFDSSLWEGIEKVEPFDMEDGDANKITKFRDAGAYDFVHASNCLEHMENPQLALADWFALLKPGGHVVFTVPDEDLYEQGVFPSAWNADHKWTFSIYKNASWCDKSMNIPALFRRLGGFRVLRIRLVDTNYDYSLHGRGVDQTFPEDGAEAFIEVVVQKQIVESKRAEEDTVFLHSGARGDIIYGLPTIKSYGGGILVLNLTDKHYVGRPIMHGEDYEQFAELLESAPYIKEVRQWTDEVVDINLDLFREMDIDYNLLSGSHLKRFGADFDLSQPWMDAEPKTVEDSEIIVSCSGRYRGYLDWDVLKPWDNRCLFVGFESEYDAFVRETGMKLRGFYRAQSYLDLARVIKGGKLFVGNQSFPYSLAEAMKVPRVLEVCDDCPNCMPQSENGWVRLRPDVIQYYVDGKGKLPSNKHPYRSVHRRNQFILPIRKGRRQKQPSYENMELVSVIRHDRQESADGLFICVMFNEDCKLEGGWIDCAVKPFERHSVGVVVSPDSKDFAVLSRKCFEHIGALDSFDRIVQEAFRNRYTVIHCDALRRL